MPITNSATFVQISAVQPIILMFTTVLLCICAVFTKTYYGASTDAFIYGGSGGLGGCVFVSVIK